MAVQFCGTCGHPLIPDQLFCQHCGSRADDNATRGAPPVTPGIPVSSGGTLYCGECGALVGSQDRVCRRCGALVEPSAGPVSDPSLSDAPTQRVTPPPPAFQPASALQAPPPPAYQTPPTPGFPQTPPPGYPAQPPSGWGASYTPSPYNDSPTFTNVGSGPAVQAPPYRPVGPGGPPSGGGQRWPLVLGLVLAALILIVGGGVVLAFHPFSGKPQANNPTPTATTGITPTPTVIPSPTPVVLNTDTARALVTQYYTYINQKNYDAAYDLLSQEWMARMSRQTFDSGFSNTLQDTLTIVSAEVLSDGTVQVDITLQAQHTDGSIINYAGYYIVTKENEKLVLLTAKVNQQ